MKKRPSDDQRAKLLMAALRSASLGGALDRLSNDDPALYTELSSARLRSEIREVVEASHGTFESRLESLRRSAGPQWVEFAALGPLISGNAQPMANYSRMESAASGKLQPDSYFWAALRVAQSRASRTSGDARASEFHLRDAQARIAAYEHPMLRMLCSSFVECENGHVHQSNGDYASAYRAFTESERISREYALAMAPIAASRLASLLWATGQFRRALEMHRSEEHRVAGAALGPAWLVPSHLSAAKCAIDLGEAATAQSELGAAEQLLRESSSLPRNLRGYAILYAGELEVLHGRLDPAVARFNEACDWFETMEPPFHAGLLDAKVAMAHHAISKRDHERLFPIIHKLLEEAEEKGCLEARARLLVLESALFVSENPPLSEAFDDIVTRMHLIQNPALMLQALANLYIHSLRYLDTPDQAFLMARLRRLQEVLEESHYQDLYEQHIEKRYSWAIENRLAEFLEADESLLESEEEPERG